MLESKRYDRLIMTPSTINTDVTFTFYSVLDDGTVDAIAPIISNVTLLDELIRWEYIKKPLNTADPEK